MATTNKVKGWSGVLMTEDSSFHWPIKRRHVYSETSRQPVSTAAETSPTVGFRSIIHNGFYRTRSGKRRRYRCGECGKTFSSTKGTPYYRLQHRRATFDGVIALRVEGISISAISRIKGIAWNTVARWLEKAAQVCRRFNHRRIAGFAAEELQAEVLPQSSVGGCRVTRSCDRV